MLNQGYKNKLYEYVTRNLGLRNYVRGWLKGTCPSCGRLDKFGVNLGMNRTNCFVCGYHPSPIVLVMETESLPSISEALIFLKTFEGLTYIEPTIKRIESKPVYYPEGYHNIITGSSVLANIVRGYVKKRKFDIDEVSLKGWGYCTKGKYFGYLILPFYTGGVLTYFNGRRVVGNGPKYNNPEIEEFGIGKSLILYNADALAMYEEVALLEGVINAETLGDNGIATGGKNIADYQISLINKSPVKRVIVVLDPDAFENSIRIGLALSFHKEVKLVTWDGDKDVNDIGRKEAQNRILSKPWLNYNDILKLRLNYSKDKSFTL
jgi:hypothetical protein